MEETLEALDRLVLTGKVRRAGRSNFDAAEVARALTKLHHSQLTCLQNKFRFKLREGEL